MTVKVERFETGPLATNTYLASDPSGHCLVFDPSSGCDDVIAAIGAHKLAPDAIVLTHAHFDHILGVPEVLRAFPGLPLYVHQSDREYLRDPIRNGSFMIGEKFEYDGAALALEEGAMRLGPFDAVVVNVPGHTPGGCAIVIDNVCFCGDVLFAGSVGRADLPGGDWELLIEGIKKKLLSLPDTTIVCPGHGGRTTIGREKRQNPYIV